MISQGDPPSDKLGKPPLSGGSDLTNHREGPSRIALGTRDYPRIGTKQVKRPQYRIRQEVGPHPTMVASSHSG